MSDHIRRDTGMSGDATGGTRTDIGAERHVHDVGDGPTPETRTAMHASEGEGHGGPDADRDITEGPTPETREAIEEDARRHRDRI